MNIKVLVSLVIAALLLVGCAAPVPGESDNAAPAIHQDNNTVPESTVETPMTDATEPVATVTELTADEAAAIALNHAGVAPENATELKVERDEENGTPEWEVEFRWTDYEYDYTVQATTGDILHWNEEYDPIAPVVPVETTPVETEPPATEPPATEPAPVELSKDEAIAVALAHAKLEKADVTGLKAKKDRDDGRVEWEIEFRSGDYEYDYTVHAETGKVLEHDKEYDPVKKTDEKPAETQPPATEPPATEPAPVELSKDEAVAVALEHAKLDKSQVTELKAKKDRDDGRVEWEIEFRSGDYEYDYTIHAETGKILDHDKEYDPPEKKVEETVPAEPAPTVTLTADEAVAIALQHAGLKAEEVTHLETESDDDEPKWEVEFKHGKTEYSYTVHSQTGKVLDWEKEIDD